MVHSGAWSPIHGPGFTLGFAPEMRAISVARRLHGARAMRAAPFLVFLSTSIASTACGGDDSSASGQQQDQTERPSATITFDAKWNETLDGRLVEGGKAVLVYDDTRLAKCKGEQGGVPQYAVTAYASIDGGEPESVVVAGLNAAKDPSIALGDAGELEIWFEVTNKWGCHEWDSDFGNNYRFQVAAP